MAETTAPPAPEREKWPSTQDAYELLEEIGFGASAVVHRAVCLPMGGRPCAVKVVDLDKYGDALELMRREITTMSQLEHPNVVSYHTSFVVKNALWLVVRFMDSGSCYDILRFQYPGGLNNEVLIATLLKETLSGLEYFHNNGHVHRDIKAGNILLDTEGHVAVGDFGVCAALIQEGGRVKAQTFVGTPCWMAPEVMEQKRDKGYGQKVDIWSFGITALELANGRAPHSNLPPMKVLLTILESDPPKLDRHRENLTYSRAFKDMIAQCLQKSPEARPSATKLLEHKFFKQAKKSQYVKDELVSKIPPLQARLKAMREGEADKKQLAAESLAEWDFEEIKNEIKAASSGGRPPALERDPSAGGSSGGDSDRRLSQAEEKKGRFAIKTSTDGGPGAPTKQESKGRFTVKGSQDSDKAPEQKGRFAVKSRDSRGDSVIVPPTVSAEEQSETAPAPAEIPPSTPQQLQPGQSERAAVTPTADEVAAGLVDPSAAFTAQQVNKLLSEQNEKVAALAQRERELQEKLASLESENQRLKKQG